MKMKLYILIFVSAVIFGITSCSEFLEEENKAGTTADLTYSTKTGIDGLLAGCYSFGRLWYGKEPGLGLSEMGTDLFYYGYDNKQKSLNSYNLTAVSLDNNVSDNPCLDQYWEAFYCATDVCSNAIRYIPKCPAIGENIQNQYLGEAYFLRAFYYFHMVNIWGPIPYNSSTINSIITNPVRMPEEEVYSNILADIDKSISYFDLANYRKKTDGRANYWAARALKARILLYAASWLGRNSIISNLDYSGKDLYQLSQIEADAVIGSPISSFYTKYEDTWSMNNEDIAKNNEAIWGITYSSDLTSNVNCPPKRYRLDEKSGAPRDYNSLITRTGYTRGGSSMLLMFVGMWNNGADDLGGNGKETFVRALADPTNIQHYVTKVNVNVVAKYSPYGRGFTRYLPSVYLWKLLDKYRSTDQRTAATLLEAYTIAPGLEGSSARYPLIKDTAIYYCPLDGNSPEGIAKQAWAKDRYRIQFLSGGEIPVYTSSDPSVALPTEAAVPVSNVYLNSYHLNPVIDNNPNNDTIWTKNRYNSYKIGGWCSFPCMKKFLDNVYNPTYPTHDISSRDAIVLRRAEMYLIKAECQLYTESGSNAMNTINELRAVRAIPGQNNLLTGEADIETILEERAIELCGEQQRWFDLKRTKKLVSHVKAYNAQAKNNIQEFHYLRPIPQDQFNAITNRDTTGTQAPGTFWQNPGY